MSPFQLWNDISLQNDYKLDQRVYVSDFIEI